MVGFAAGDSFAWSPGGHDGDGHHSYGGYDGGHQSYGYGGHDRDSRRGHDSWRGGYDYRPYYAPRVYASEPYYYRAPVVIYERPCYDRGYCAPVYRSYSRPTFRFSFGF